MTITALPTPPSRGQSPSTFSSDADTFLNALPTMVTQINAATVNMDTQYGYVYSNVASTATNASQASTAANSAVSAKNNIEILFLGSKSSNPSTNNSGGTLVVGCKYFNTTVGEDRVWTGTNWVSSTAIGGTVSGLNIDGELKLKTNTWHKDGNNAARLYLEQGGSDATIIRGNQLVYWNNANAELFKIINNGSMYAYGQSSLNSGGVFLSNHSVTIGSQNGGNNSVGIGLTSGGQGAYGQIAASGVELAISSNSYYASGNDRFSVNGYAPKIRLFNTDNTIVFQQTDNGSAGGVQSIQTAARFDTLGVLSVSGRNGYGSIALNGSPTGTGFISFHQTSGARSGYIGNSSDAAGDQLRIVSENSKPWQFDGMAPRSSVDATTSNDLPRLSQFASSQANNGYTKLPNGLILQWGRINCSANGGTTATLPINFPTSVFCAFSTGTDGSWGNADSSNINVTSTSLSSIVLTNFAPQNQIVYWMAIGN